MSDVAEKVTKIIVDQLGVSADEVKPEASFVEDLGADSLDLTELIMAMEEAFDVEIGSFVIQGRSRNGACPFRIRRPSVSGGCATGADAVSRRCATAHALAGSHPQSGGNRPPAQKESA